jgi:ribosomal protein S18 acetylase RimI-like enzyme
MAQEPTIRESRASDVDGIQRVACAAWHAAYDDILGVETVDSVVEEWYDADGLRDTVTDSGHVFLVAEHEGDVVGFADSTRRGDEDEVAVLARIYVDPDHWNDGIGGVLLARSEYLLSERGFEHLRLVVFADNDIGVSFYESSGFERVESREAEFDRETHEEYVYEKRL